jgi:hypothetical protein
MAFGNLFRSLGAVTIIGGLSLAAVTAQRPSTPIHEHPRYKKWPITDFDKPGPSDPEARKKGKAKGDRFGLLDKSIDPRRFAITEGRGSTFGGPDLHSPPEPALPVGKSSAIVIAEVAFAEAFLSTDQVSIYSEFSLNVREVIHTTSLSTIRVGDSIQALRAGGGVRFPSGKVILQGNDARPLPDAGSTYVFFLNEVDSAGFFEIVTAYQILAGKVYPLDGRSPHGLVFRQFAEHQKLAGTEETAFLYFVRRAIQDAAGNPAEVN